MTRVQSVAGLLRSFVWALKKVLDISKHAIISTSEDSFSAVSTPIFVSKVKTNSSICIFLRSTTCVLRRTSEFSSCFILCYFAIGQIRSFYTDYDENLSESNFHEMLRMDILRECLHFFEKLFFAKYILSQETIQHTGFRIETHTDRTNLHLLLTLSVYRPFGYFSLFSDSKYDFSFQTCKKVIEKGEYENVY